VCESAWFSARWGIDGNPRRNGDDSNSSNSNSSNSSSSSNSNSTRKKKVESHCYKRTRSFTKCWTRSSSLGGRRAARRKMTSPLMQPLRKISSR